MNKKKLIRGGAIYVLPNLLTTGNLFFGYFSIVKSMQGKFELAAVAVLLAAVFDILDGRVARLTNSSSEFGVQYDSLCDLISFGLAPAFLMYQYALNTTGKLGWILCFIFLACGALRLARFNVQSSIGKASGDFTGLPIPMAAGVVACFVAFMVELDELASPEPWWLEYVYSFFKSGTTRVVFLSFLAPMLAGLMVSNISYRSHKSLKIKGIKPFRLLAVLVVVMGLSAYNPPLVGFILFFTYASSGLLELLMGWKKPSDDDDIFEPIEEDTSLMEPAGDTSSTREEIKT